MYGPLFWMDGGEWSWVGHYILGWWGWLGMIGDEWGWMGVSGCGCTVNKALLKYINISEIPPHHTKGVRSQLLTCIPKYEELSKDM